MLNNFALIGRLVSDPKINETEEGKKVATITLAVSRSFKNAEGVYDTDFIPVTLLSSIASNTCEYCRKGDLVGAKGRIQNTDNILEMVAEKITFLATKKD